MQIWAESGKSALPICNYSQILYQFLTFTQNLKRSRFCGTVHFHAKQQNAKELSANSTLLHPLKIAVIRKSPAPLICTQNSGHIFTN